MHVLDVSSFEEYLENLDKIGFQSTQIGRGAEILKAMIKEKSTNYLAFTANIVASGMKGLIAKMIEKELFNIIITTGGAIEHDLMKTFTKYEIIDFASNDAKLHREEVNRIGNIGVRSESYIFLEKVCKEIFSKMMEEKRNSPSDIAYYLGQYISENGGKNKEHSFLYWAYKHGVKVYSPGITDSAIGLQAYFFKQEHKDFVIDVTGDMKALASTTLNAEKTGALVLGGGISKHHTIGVNLLRGGLDYAIYISTATEFDGSLSGARSSEAISWGKIKEKASHVDIHLEATVALPLLLKKAGII
jgi:deoxyhypusine synthase